MKVIHNKRVMFYECTVQFTSTGSSSTKNYPFTQELADVYGFILHEDGVDMDDAIKCCNKMATTFGFGSIRYTYNIPSDVSINHIQP